MRYHKNSQPNPEDYQGLLAGGRRIGVPDRHPRVYSEDNNIAGSTLAEKRRFRIVEQ